MLYCLSQAPSERQPSGEFANWRARILERMMMLTSSVSLETSMPSAGSFMVPVSLAIAAAPPRIDRPCTQDQRQSASQDTVQSEKRSAEGGAGSTSLAHGRKGGHRLTAFRAVRLCISRRTTQSYKGGRAKRIPPAARER